DYLAKPFRFEELDLRVERVIRRTLMLRQAVHEQVAGAPKPPPAPPPPDASGVLHHLLGSLQHIGLSALLTMIEMERKSGLLVLWNDPDPARASQVGRLWVRGGRVVRAR